MVKILNTAYESKPKKWRDGRKKKLTIENQLLLTLKYLRQYVTQKELAFEFEVGESTVCYTIKWVEDTLIKDGSFSLPRKKLLLEDDGIEVVLVDVTECPIERPQKTKKMVFWKKKRHTFKAQIIVNRANGIIICTAENYGKTHGFTLYKNTIGGRVIDSIKEQADSGYQGISKFHRNSETPKKKPKGRELTEDEKSENRCISCERILIENINAKIKTFKIMKIPIVTVENAILSA